MGHRAAGADTSERVLTVPNVITTIRLLLLPVFLWLLFNDHRVSAAWLLGGLGATDFVDGYIARRFDQTSALGKILDPVADRLLFFVGVGGILVAGAMPLWFAVSLLSREILVTAGTLALAALGAARIDVTWFGKAGTLCNMFAVPLWLAHDSPDLGWQPLAGLLAWGFSIPGLVLGWYAAALYVPLARKALAEGRRRGQHPAVGSAP